MNIMQKMSNRAYEDPYLRSLIHKLETRLL